MLCNSSYTMNKAHAFKRREKQVTALHLYTGLLFAVRIFCRFQERESDRACGYKRSMGGKSVCGSQAERGQNQVQSTCTLNAVNPKLPSTQCIMNVSNVCMNIRNKFNR
jgi:hypothetical protein